MTPDEITALFTDDGSYRFARWGRPMAPVVFGVDDATLRVVKDAFAAVAMLTGQALAETDPELGVNTMVFFFRDWAELIALPDLERMIPDLPALVGRLEAGGANQYRTFRFDEAGAIKATFVFLRIDGALARLPAEVIALGEAVQVALLWSVSAFSARSPLAETSGGVTVLRPEIAAVIRAAYDPAMPATADDPSHALRLFARAGLPG